MTNITPAKIDWNETGTPVSLLFDDIYFSTQDGLEESRYVFLEGNQLPLRFASHPETCLTIAETGFGTGLNVLLLWQMFLQFRQTLPNGSLKRLHIVSFERYPLLPNDFLRAYTHLPTLSPLAKQLHTQLPPMQAGQYLIHLDQHITLTLIYGDVNHTITQLSTSKYGIDAWFLDGFAPSKNPDMWSEHLFKQMYRLTRSKGTFATFTAAGFVRRGLIQAGFKVSKRPGFGHKREMLIGIKPNQ